MKENSKISIPEMADKVGISTTAIEKNIRYLKKQGIVGRIGPAKGGYRASDGEMRVKDLDIKIK